MHPDLGPGRGPSSVPSTGSSPLGCTTRFLEPSDFYSHPRQSPCGSLVILPTHFWSKISEMGLSGESKKNSLTSPMSPNHQGNTAQGQENAVSLLFLSWGKLRVCEQDTVNGTHFCLTPSRILSVSLGLLSSWVN